VRVRILYFAALAEEVDRRSEELETRAVSAQELIRQLKSRGEPWQSAFDSRLRIAINQHLATPEDPISDDDEVAFFPPVTGG
jgi:molybdopterin synthase sulfur carrier subunit